MNSDQPKTGIIYKVSSPSGNVYIGQTISELKKRKQIHEYRAKSNKAKDKFAHAIRKYGNKLKWEILHNNILVSQLGTIEQKEIEIHDSFNNGYNGTLGGGDGGFRGKNHSKKTKEILSAMRKGLKNPMYGQSGSLNPFYGKKHSEKTKKKKNEKILSLIGHT